MPEAIRFTPQELTGRSRGHIIELEDPRCGLHREVVLPFLEMRAAAAADGIDLVPISSFRDFDRQLAIWNGKHRGERELRAIDGSLLDARTMDEQARTEAILHWSALPGASRHHWGTDMDVIDARSMPAGYRPQLVTEEFAADGMFARLDRWLAANAAAHGFFRPYSTWRGGVQPEPWHISHAPVAGAAMAQLTVEVLRDALDAASVEGKAAVEALLPAIFERYVCNFDPWSGAATSSRPA
jgi:LAS superfamily LD-carboxypeptidase LdcB